MRTAIAVLIGDPHIDINPPIARSVEKDWPQKQREYFEEIEEVAKARKIPVICSGDIFNKWNTSPESINLAMEILPERFFSIAGNHDLPNHRIEDIDRSAYWSLCYRGIYLKHIWNSSYYDLNNLFISGCSYGQEIKPILPYKHPDIIKLAVVHRYCWVEGSSFDGAPEENHVSKLAEEVKSYDVCLVGDNHKAFIWKDEGLTIYNPGSFMRRNIDQKTHIPQYGILYSTGEVEVHPLKSAMNDKFLDTKEFTSDEIVTGSLVFSTFISELGDLRETTIDFAEVCKHWMMKRNIRDRVQHIVLGAIEKGEM